MSRVAILFLASSLMVAADFFLFLGIEKGIVGVVVALVGSNFVLVTIVSALMGRASLIWP